VRGLLDTSVFIARESGRPLEPVPDAVTEVAVSVITVAELRLGVLTAADDTRDGRLATYDHARTFEPLPVDTEVAERFAALVADAKRLGTRPKLHDTWIAATALAHDAAVVTQDTDFDHIAGLNVFKV
jgi:predicted nucleic acid-binding protein